MNQTRSILLGAAIITTGLFANVAYQLYRDRQGENRRIADQARQEQVFREGQQAQKAEVRRQTAFQEWQAVIDNLKHQVADERCQWIWCKGYEHADVSWVGDSKMLMSGFMEYACGKEKRWYRWNTHLDLMDNGYWGTSRIAVEPATVADESLKTWRMFALKLPR